MSFLKWFCAVDDFCLQWDPVWQHQQLAAAPLPLCAYRRSCLGSCTGLSFLDSTPLAACDRHRIAPHKALDGVARRGKSSIGWLLGFKLHGLVNDRGKLLTMALTLSNVDDHKPVPRLVKPLFGKICTDTGDLSRPLFTRCWTPSVSS